MTSEQAEKYGYSKELDTLTRKMCKKFTTLNITRDEYLLLKSIILFNIGEYIAQSSRCPQYQVIQIKIIVCNKRELTLIVLAKVSVRVV